MKTCIDSFFARDVKTFTQRISQLDEAVDPAAPVTKDRVYSQLLDILRDMVAGCQRLESIIGCNAAALRDTQQRFQAATAEWFDRSWIGQRARSKPRGYPGDYLLLNTIYDEQPKSPGLGGYIDLYIMDLLLAHSVRARWQAMRRFLLEELAQREGDVSILNVACGPCREYVAGFDGVASGRVQVTCLDNDQEALDFVTANIAPQAKGLSIRTQRYNALRMKSAEATVRNFGRSDIIYSIGLCDYISDEYLIGMLEGWRKSLADDGVLFVAFKDTCRYDETPYQWLLDWHFLLRTEEDCRLLFQEAGFDPRELTMARDATGVIMNFVSRAKAAAPTRIDASHAPGKPLPHSSPANLPLEANSLRQEVTETLQ